MREVTFLICRHCGNIVEMIKPSGVPVKCCGESMDEIVPNTVDAAHEKHLPSVSVENGAVKVQVGSVQHPMLDAHYIEWAYLITELGAQARLFKPGETPEATFLLAPGDAPVSVYSYCNLHGLWRVDL